MKTIVIKSVKSANSHKTEVGGKVVLRFDAETDDGPVRLHIEQPAASDLRAFLGTPVTGMKSGGPPKLLKGET